MPLSELMKQRLVQYNPRRHTGGIDTKLSPDEWNELLVKGLRDGFGTSRKEIITKLCRLYISERLVIKDAKNRRL